MRRRRAEEVKKGAPEWMNTYGDMVTLLLTFFIMLFAMSTIEDSKFNDIIQSIQSSLGSYEGAIGLLNGGTSINNSNIIGDGEEVDPNLEQITAVLENIRTGQVDSNIGQNDMESIYYQVKDYLENNNLSEEIVIIQEDKGLLIRFKDNVLFDSGKAVIKENAKVILNNIANILNEVDRDIRVEGHTDNRPINTPQFPSNWELSTQRAVNVLKYFIEINGIAPARLSAVGYGEYHPIADNSTEEGRQKNRRVDIVILRESTVERSTVEQGEY